jgi:hypothetical protein
LRPANYRPICGRNDNIRIRPKPDGHLSPMTSIYRDLESRPGQAYRVSSGAHVDTEAKTPASLPAITRDDAKWIPVRKARPVNVLLPATRRWLTMLAPDARPQALVTQFPRLANRVAADWKSPEMCRAFLHQLLVDQRGNRQGFPKDVARDILALRSIYSELHPATEGLASTLDW